MAQLNGLGPENKGYKTGRALGSCRKVTEDEALQKLGKGMGLRRNAGGGTGKEKRLRSGVMLINT
jgi:hypothetical protein